MVRKSKVARDGWANRLFRITVISAPVSFVVSFLLAFVSTYTDFDYLIYISRLVGLLFLPSLIILVITSLIRILDKQRIYRGNSSEEGANSRDTL